MVNKYVGAGQAIIGVGKKVIKKVFGKKSRVSPDIKSVKPNLKKTVRETKSEAEFKNFEKVEKFRKQKEEGIKSARKAQKELQRAAETKRATKIGRQYFARSIPPRASDLNNPTVAKTKKFKTGKQLEAEKRNKASKKAFMGGGMVSRRMGYKGGSKKGKVPTTPKEKAFGMLSVNKGLDKNKNITFTDKIAGATGVKKKKRVI